MLRNLHTALHFHETRQATHPARRSAAPAAAWPIAAALRAILDGWRDGLGAHRQYEQLRSRGVPHDTALSEALGIGRIPASARRAAAKPLCFAGRA